MHCKSCEVLVEEKLTDISGVEKVEANFKNSEVDLYFTGKQPADAEIEKAIRDAGYSIGSDKEDRFISKNFQDYQDLAIVVLLLAGIYAIFKYFGIFNLNFVPADATSASLAVVLLVGLTAGISTCMALVGGLVLGISARAASENPTAGMRQKFSPHLFFNLGRIIVFAVLGGLLGVFGSIFQLSSLVLGIFTILIGLLMLIMGFQLIDIFPWINRFKITLPKSLNRVLRIDKAGKKKYSHKLALTLGALTFFLPCGFTQSMQLLAISSGNFVSGALIMGIFALGTAPGLLSIGGAAAAAKGNFRKKFFKFAGVLVIIFSFFNISNGYALTGWQLGSDGNPQDKTEIAATDDPNVRIENGVQVVRMKELSRGYSPNRFTIQKGLPVKWLIEAEDPYSCAASLIVPRLDISKRLKAGENVIEFTPTEIGDLKFSCSMGMYRGVFNVIEKEGGFVDTDASTDSDIDPSSGSGCRMMGNSDSRNGGCGMNR